MRMAALWITVGILGVKPMEKENDCNKDWFFPPLAQKQFDMGTLDESPPHCPPAFTRPPCSCLDGHGLSTLCGHQVFGINQHLASAAG